MPARLHFSNSLAPLADALIANLGQSADPFDSPAVAYPHAALRDWLKTRLAGRTGIAVNVGFETLENLLWQRLAELDRFREAPDRRPAQRLETAEFQGLILHVLRRRPPDALRAYLDSDPVPEPRDDARRLCRLSGKLAALFREYEYSRVTENGFRGLAETWSLGQDCFGQGLRLLPQGDERRARLEDARVLEAWQREIYRELFRPGDGLRDRWGKTTGAYRYTLPQYAHMALADPRPRREGGRVFHLFGLSEISPFHRDLIRRLADAESLGPDAAHFEIYALNPCSEYWEDARRAHWTREQLQAEELAPENRENALLVRFGKPGRETVTLWNQTADYDCAEHFQAPAGKGLLAALQEALLRRSGPLPEDGRLEQDASLRVGAAPDPFAEAEAAKEDLLAKLRDDATLRPEDIGVALADAEAYLPVAETIFADLPHCAPESGSLRESALARGFRALLESALIPLRPSALLDYLENPCAAAPFSTAGFREFLARAGFREGWDDSQRRAAGAAAGSESTLDAAWRRVLLGLAMDPEDPGLEKAGLHPVAEPGTERETLSAWLEFLRRLRADLEPMLAGRSWPYSAWGKWLQSLLAGYFAADTGDEAPAAAALRRFFASLERGSEFDEGEVSHHLILALLEDHFREPGAARGSLLPGGIRIGSLEALRGLPFRHLYILGLNGGAFPRPAPALRSGGLDLRAFRRVLGESDPAARDLYAFLESLAAATESVRLSYLRREDWREDKNPVGASYAVTGLIAYLESDLLRPDRRFQVEACEGDGSLESARLAALFALAPEPARQAALQASPAPATGSPASEITGIAMAAPAIRLQDLRLFLLNPLEHAFRHFRLHRSLDEEEDDAPSLAFNRWESRDFLAAALRSELAATGSGLPVLRAGLARRHGIGQSPAPPFDALESERLESDAATLFAAAGPGRDFLRSQGLIPAGTLRLGYPPVPPRPPVAALPALAGACGGRPIRVEGDGPFLFRGARSWAMLCEAGFRQEALLYLLHLGAAACSHPLGSGTGHILLWDVKKKALDFFRLPPWEPSRARRAWENLLEDFARVPDLDLLSLEAVEELRDKTSADPVPKGGRGWKEALESKWTEKEEKEFGSGAKNKALRALNPQVPDDAAEKIRRRAAPFLAWLDAREAA